MEVCPRDGWQNIKEFIPTDLKISLIKNMLDSGIKSMQLSSFVHPKAIPQLRDAQEVVGTIVGQYPDRSFNALVPNLYGAKQAVECGLQEVSYVISISESHNKANINRTHEQSFAGLVEIRQAFPDLSVILSLATTFGCPFEGETPLAKVVEFVARGSSLGIRKIELADTIGVGYPAQVERIFKTLRREFPEITFIAHIHDTRNNGILNSWVAMENGADVIHTALGGLGGCPFAPGASGNTSTEDFVYLLGKSGIATGIDFGSLIAVAKKMRGLIDGNYSGHHINIASDGYEALCR
jgi:hydroxymethylglutaryl-CoA lyase